LGGRTDSASILNPGIIMANYEVMKTEFIKQYEHTWRVFEGIVRDFDLEAWLHTGHGTMTPARTACHLLQGVKYYIDDTSPMVLTSGQSFDSTCATVPELDLPSPDDILAGLADLRAKTQAWLSALDLEADNRSLAWTGETNLSVVIFLLRHSLYHLGELSCLLNENRHGQAEDNWVKALSAVNV
jgi:hypothetical protein